eukprot:12973741-Heterocapsa_arctica.AAC.1
MRSSRCLALSKLFVKASETLSSVFTVPTVNSPRLKPSCIHVADLQMLHQTGSALLQDGACRAGVGLDAQMSTELAASPQGC